MYSIPIEGIRCYLSRAFSTAQRVGLSPLRNSIIVVSHYGIDHLSRVGPGARLGNGEIVNLDHDSDVGNP
jgi:hypothetical protein